MYEYDDEYEDVAGASIRPPEVQVGITRSLTTKFREMRSEKMDSYNTDINKLVIRLEKLMNGLSSDPVKRKTHEQAVVSWMDDSLVNLCPSCGSSFNLTRRKHHCRLCGAITCNACSQYLPIADALKLSNKKLSEESMQQASLPDFRVCMPCYERLEHRTQKVASKTARPIICQFYDKLQHLQADASVLLAEYNKMHSSLCSGESMYDLRDAQMTRLKLVQLAEQIEHTSKSILILGTKSNEESAPRGRTLRLQQSVRASASNFIRDNLMGLPTLPSEMELKDLRSRVRSGISSRMNQSGGPKSAHVMQGAGWGTYTSSSAVVESDDPIVQQINLVRGYIKQAKEAGRLDEVFSLEENLKLLETTYWQQQGQ
ncbi:rabenosyn-5 [Neocloeon triangulifer]|uniref:rabenosyn-5 n=1 Tax=Neocloeon triangulifer TaxID=2078957 RepID=UPI00286F37F8|nr:rabenosyn-5 [Neocloeon triangulifer]XP_059471198.1 rabenosyn-5 [Neocloeon triangulifer]